MKQPGQFQTFEDAYILDALRTPMVDYQGAFADATPSTSASRPPRP
mgnify:CR=1 FL=1